MCGASNTSNFHGQVWCFLKKNAPTAFTEDASTIFLIPNNSAASRTFQLDVILTRKISCSGDMIGFGIAAIWITASQPFMLERTWPKSVVFRHTRNIGSWPLSVKKQCFRTVWKLYFSKFSCHRSLRRKTQGTRGSWSSGTARSCTSRRVCGRVQCFFYQKSG